MKDKIEIINKKTSINIKQVGTPGKSGGKGDDGSDGLSAYEIWLEAGNVGTETDYLNSLKGQPGSNGLSAYEVWLEAGNVGTETDYLNSLKGQPGGKGDDGLSAYEVWLNAGNIGTETDYLNSLKGQPGNDGTNGVGVVAGGTTGQVLTKKSNTNYDTEWTTPSSGGASYTAGSGITINNNIIYSNIRLTNNRVAFAGIEAAAAVTTGVGIVAFGYRAYRGRNNNNVTAIGEQSLADCGLNSANNTGLGYQALRFTQGSNNIGVGNNTTANGDYNVLIGHDSYTFDFSSYSTIIGHQANNGGTFNNCSALGYQATTTGANQVQLGNSSTNVYVFGTVQSRSDRRDKFDINDIDNALDFLMLLKPKTYKFNYRDAYFDYENYEEEIEVLNEETQLIEKETITKTRKVEVENDGSRAGLRTHSGLIAQDVEEALKTLGIDLALFQDHKIKGGEDVKSLGYNGFIAYLIKAVQEQQLMINDLKKEVDILKGKI